MLVAVWEQFSEFGSWWRTVSIGNNQRSQIPNPYKSAESSCRPQAPWWANAFQVMLNIIYLFHRTQNIPGWMHLERPRGPILHGKGSQDEVLQHPFLTCIENLQHPGLYHIHGDIPPVINCSHWKKISFWYVHETCPCATCNGCSLSSPCVSLQLPVDYFSTVIKSTLSIFFSWQKKNTFLQSFLTEQVLQPFGQLCDPPLDSIQSVPNLFKL